MARREIADTFRIPDELWERVQLFLPRFPRQKTGRPRLEPRKVVDGIFYILRTGCQWKAAPSEFGSGSTLHDYFQKFVARGFFRDLWEAGLFEYESLKGIKWDWQSIDGAMTKAPLGGKKTGPNPTDRAKSGTKRSLLTDGAGVPLSVVVDGANTHDKRLVERTLEEIVAPRPRPSRSDPQHFCGDKGYDYPDTRELVEEYGYTLHIKSRGDEARDLRAVPRYRARRWVVERTHSWLNRFRRLLIRWEKKADNFLAMLHFACAYITFRAAGLFG
ncbi:MAG: IS5 family transposase [Planctomycetota bacterium]